MSNVEVYDEEAREEENENKQYNQKKDDLHHTIVEEETNIISEEIGVISTQQDKIIDLPEELINQICCSFGWNKPFTDPWTKNNRISQYSIKFC